MLRKKLYYRGIERIAKGFANHRRAQIMELLSEEPELSVEEIATRVRTNYKTASVHIQRLALSGLIMKRSAGNAVRHALTSRGKTILKFLRTLE